ncbi:MAG: hypothetical protein H7263_01725 [Candidatus Sericytochromatia bacterium]|nr:hypothetical protein [Candidatus Sericytochromatia bacterium]
MKKYTFAVTLLFILNTSLYAFAQDKKSILGNNLDVENAAKKTKGTGNVFYDSTVGKPAEKKVEGPKPAATPIPVLYINGNGSVNPQEVKRNQNKEDYMAQGKIFLAKNDFQKALGEFKKAKSVASDYMVDAWIAVAANKIKIQEVNKKIEIMSMKSTLH